MIKITYFSERKELRKNNFILTRLHPSERILVTNFIKDVIQADKKLSYKKLFSALLTIRNMEYYHLDEIFPNYEYYLDILDNIKDRMFISKEEENKIMNIYGTIELRENLNDDELRIRDFTYKCIIKEKDKVIKRLKKKKYIV